ncbi:MAG: peptidylprolyl isomerase [Thiotrichaceae bacterium]|nr:peptidylprolyl isomerase [Thiotrichaceae bacterium]
MKIDTHKAITLSYTLKDNDGTLLDSADKSEPFIFIYGTGNVIPGLENALKGKEKGDTFKVHLAAADAYGEYTKELLQKVSKEMFKGMEEKDLFEGAQFHAETNQGMQVIKIKTVASDHVIIDGNHPMAGKELNFDVTIDDVRDSTKEELAHGHIHADGSTCSGHDH